ncbi:hypothetical protein [Natronomonas sp. EA1]|uniref:DUF7837 family putative zinc-binding protein n=1 Tax=Natronomonas sp. EA1 TaxID=3421655 RepID=UPI003EBE7BEE
MSHSDATLGRCPDCDIEIPRGNLLIEYDTAAGRALYAECPQCQDVVHPAE